MKKNTIRIEVGVSPIPEKHELIAAGIIAEHLKSDIIFLRRRPNASPDLRIERTNQIWELKSPKGNGKRTMSNNLRDASRQSSNVIIDLSRCKMDNKSALSRISDYFKNNNTTIKKLLIIDKSKKVIDFINNK